MRSKYTKPDVTVYRRGADVHIKGTKKGPKNHEEMLERVNGQAQSLITKFGGPRELARILKETSGPEFHYAPSTIYRWMYPREVGGTGGEIPTAALKRIKQIARIAGVILTAADIYPNWKGRIPD